MQMNNLYLFTKKNILGNWVCMKFWLIKQVVKNKIALVDNMNNNFFAFARYLRDLGLDVYLYTIPQTSMDHFLPEADTFKDIKSLSYIKSFPCSMKKGWLFFPKRKIKQEFESYDFFRCEQCFFK